MKIRTVLGRKGFTLVEIMIVVAIIGLLAAVAIPNFMRARQQAQRNACIANLKQVDGAKTLWALDTGNTGTPDWTDLVTAYIKAQPSCAGGGTYSINAVDEDPTCTVSGHAL
ncbi:MAG TPA: prepilin-type N-terminal cleavage/methylation domain-containing protein [Candidatus Omnitrophota bacterium]|nr:prepilin-type N-terminal cleavage/methylation domain-containing protein [Candidatus Omnitrophota bacterium]